jgi:hypothetical protein
MIQQFGSAVVRSSQFLLVRNKIVDCFVAGLAHFHTPLHLLAGEPLLEPFVAVQGARNEVMEAVGVFRLAEFA